MKNNAYWTSRFEQMEEAVNKRANTSFTTIERQFNQAQRDIEKKIQVWYQRFADNNEISMQEARKWLNTKELAEFKWDVQDYIKYGEQNELNHMWMKQLENASARYHISRLEALKLQTQQSLEVLYGNQLDEIDELVKNVYSDNYYHSLFELQKGFSIGWDIASIDQSRLEKIISKPWAVDGKNFSTRIWDNKSKLVNELHNELSQMLITGSSPDAAIKNISKKMNTSRNNAGRLVMTESAYFASASQQDAFNDLDVERFEIVATLDSSTSEICRSLDGKVFEMTDYQPGVTAPPFHVWCRTTTVPFFDDEFSLGERAARDEETGQTYYVPSDMNYRDWEKSFLDGGSKDGLQPVTQSRTRKQFTSLSEPFESVTLSGIEGTYAKDIENRLLDLQNNYPIIDNKIIVGTSKNKSAFGWNSSQIIGKKIKGKQHAVYRNKINLSNVLMDTKENSLKYHVNTYKSRGSKLVNDALGLTTIDHEYAHAIDTAYAIKRNKDLSKVVEQFKEPVLLKSSDVAAINQFNSLLNSNSDRLSSVIWERMKDKYKLNNIELNKKIKDELGTYAASNKNEFLAEGFANFRTLPENEKTEFIKDFETMFNEEFDKYF